MQPTAIQDAQSLVLPEFDTVDKLILKNLESEISLIPQVGNHLLKAGGKRIRPLILLLIAKACGKAQEQHSMLAATIEFIHSATLLHDDVVDDSTQRRGKTSANYIWGNATSILVGDFLHSRAYKMISGLRNFDIVDILVDTINAMSEGEVLQLEYKGTPDLTESQYNTIIECKTGKLFEAAALLGAIECDLEQRTQLGKYGLHLGCAFQLMDDVMDYQAETSIMGKNIGDDLKEGKMTLPLLRALHVGTPEQAQIIKDAIQEGGLKDLSSIQTILEETNAVAYTLKKAQHHADLALEQLSSLPDSLYKTALINITNFSIKRDR